MQNFPNIESQSWKRNASGQPIYVGYGGGGETWYIDRPHRRAQWRCRPRVANTPGLQSACRDTLAQISDYLAAFDR